MRKKIILIGGGGHCKSCIEVIEPLEQYDIIGILDKPEKVGESISGYPVIGTDADINNLLDKVDFFLVTIGQIKSPETRNKIYHILKKNNKLSPPIIARTAYVSKRAFIGKGTIIMNQAFVNTEVTIGDNCIINTGALIEHESSVGANTHISTNAKINGQCTIGSGCFIGSGTVVANNIHISDNVILSAGSIVLKSISLPGVYISNPLRRIKR